MNDPASWSIRGLSAGYCEKPVLQPLDLDLPIGLITSVMGPGGSGKTTLMCALAGSPYPESMWVRGDRGRTFETVIQVPQKPRRERSREVLEKLREPIPGSVLLLDEPFVSLPSEEHELLHHRLDELRRHHTILCVSHNLNHARRFCDHAVLLVDGELIESAHAEDFFTRPQQTRTADFLITGS